MKKILKSPLAKLRRSQLVRLILREGTAQKLALLAIAIITLTSPLLTIVSNNTTQESYLLTPQTTELVGKASDNLSQKVAYDSKEAAYIFNKEIREQKADNGAQQKITSGQYSVTVSRDPTKGIKYFDPASKQEFSITPKFHLQEGKQLDNRIIFPFKYGRGQDVQTFQGDGVKNDLVLPVPGKDRLSFDYELDLPSSLEARLGPGGEIGIYTGDSDLFIGNMSYGSDKDRQMVDEARKKAPKNKLVFNIPAPIIKQAGNKTLPEYTKAVFRLDGSKLTVKAEGLAKLDYPISIDPSLIVSSASNFATGQTDGGVKVDAANAQMVRTGITRGYVQSTVSYGTFPGNYIYSKALAYNNYIYKVGGCTANTTAAAGACTNASWTTAVYYSAITPSTGSYSPTAQGGSFSTTTSFPTARGGFGAFIYNGYMYVMGGFNTSGSGISTSYYSKINSNGTLGTWNATTSMPSASGDAKYYFGVAADAGFVYLTGGCASTSGAPTCGVATARTYHAAINADGTIGSWSAADADTALNGSVCGGSGGNARYQVSATIYNRRLYASWAQTGGTVFIGLNDDGSLACTWRSSGATLSVGAFGSPTMYTYGGWLYHQGADDGGTSTFGGVTAYMMNSDGTLGVKITVSGSGSFAYTSSVAYNGYIYFSGFHACPGGTCSPQTVFGQMTYIYNIGPPAYAPGFAATATMSTARRAACAVAYHGYVYVTGGSDTSGATLATVEYAELSGGALGAWAATTSFATSRNQHGCGVYNGRIYIVGGYNSTFDTVLSDIQYATISDTAHTVGAWATAKGSLPTTRRNQAVTIYKPTGASVAYIYSLSGQVTTGPSTMDVRDYFGAINNTTGNVCSVAAEATAGDCTTAGVISTTTDHFWGDGGGTLYGLAGSQAVAYKDKLYACGGRDRQSPIQVYNWCYFISINSNGTLGSSWTQTTSMSTTRWKFSLSVYNGHIYAAGGTSATSDANPDGLSSTEYAKINDDGTLSAWAGGPTMGSLRAGVASVAYNGVLYEIGGTTDTNANALATTEYTYILNGGPGTITAWLATTAYSNNIYDASAVAYNGYLYVSGGCTAADCNTGSPITNVVKYAPITSDGSVGSWSSATSLGTARYSHTLIAYNGYLYALGGCGATSAANTCSTTLNTTERGTVDSSGNVTAWNADTSFTTARYGHTSPTSDGFVYAIGGCTADTAGVCSAYSSSVEVSKIQSNGTLGSWAATTSFTTARAGHASVAYNGYIYIIGGQSASSTYQNDVQYGAVNTVNGTIAGWSTDFYRFAAARTGMTAFAANGYLTIMGGYNGSTYFRDDQHAPIGTTGAIAASGWGTNNNGSTVDILTNGRTRQASAWYNGYIYRIGGTSTGADGFTNVDYGGQKAQPRVGSATYYLDTDLDTVPIRLLINGTNVSNPGIPGTLSQGGVTVSYRSSTNSNNTWGANTIVNPSTSSLFGQQFTYNPLDASSTNTSFARYYLVTIAIDESQTATYTDVDGHFSTVTSFYMWYRPNAAKRLHGGKTFSSEAQTGLDAPPCTTSEC